MANNERVGGIEWEAEVDFSKVEGSSKKLESALTGVERGSKKATRALNETERAAKDAANGAGFLQGTFAKLTASFAAADITVRLITSGLRTLKNAFLGAVKDAAAFETILARISTVVDGSTKESMAVLRKEIIELSKAYPKSKEELGLGLYNILQAGIDDTAEAMKILDVSTRAAIGGVTEVGTATKVVTDIMGAYNLTADEAVEVMDAVFVGAQRGKAEFSDLAGSLGNVLQSASQLNVGIPEVVAAIETMVNAGLSSDEAATSLNAFFTSVIQTSKGTGEAADLAKELGLEFNSTALRTKGLQKFMDDLTKAVGDDEVAMNILAGNVRGFRAAASIGGKGAEFFTETLKAMEEQTGALDSAFEINANTTEAKWTKAVNAASNAGEAFGKQVLPQLGDALEDSAEILNNALPYFEAFGTIIGMAVGSVRNLIAELPNLAGAINPLIPGLANLARLVGFIRRDSGDSVFTGTLTSTGGNAATPEAASGSGRRSSKGGDEAKKLADELEKAEREYLKALADEAKANRENADIRRSELMLREKLGVLTAKERRELDTINRRLEFRKDVIEDATKAWEEQVQAIERAEERVVELNETIAQERAELQRTLEEIDADAARDAAGEVAKLIRERNEIRKASSISGDASRRLGEIDDELRGFSSSDLSEGERLAGLTSGELIEEERNRRRREAEEKANQRISDLQAELDAERAKIEILRSAEQEKKSILLSALSERSAILDANYTAELNRTTSHVNAMIAEHERLRKALRGASSSVPAFASGGPVVGPGTDTSDSIVARLSNNEHVLTARDVRAMGGHSAVLQFRNDLHKLLPRFAGGGPVTNNNQRSATINVQNYGRAAEVYADPRRARWHAKTFLG